ncbi:uncharacterized protein DUF5342 [Cytobacillus horneckiae]|uniref:YheE family protein n=1 Tax=Cytobacillus horneckiae TaxID=549687 RepID=A0A2N0ZF27_9BACI|nr:YheE family protein [Cytobacillus horneckiae]NRG45859.1 YheE family protein [Bacillus sp. CRN 9]MBN6887674.1 YheE family protein [Cytobacillus horneckiae]MCM3178731.1 YheE family protein [Cytobacillus horneckiae]MEC1158207.1 YheE family protein [Cytobacillus horneckiae]MED2940149.1 YheE family protein [Cytobacillus horneckiae]
MLTHFQYSSLYENKQLPGWKFSFYFAKQKYAGYYHQDGSIEWTSEKPEARDEEELKGRIHELMLYHVYDNQR